MLLLGISTFNAISGAFGLVLIGVGFTRWRQGVAQRGQEADEAPKGQ